MGANWQRGSLNDNILPASAPAASDARSVPGMAKKHQVVVIGRHEEELKTCVAAIGIKYEMPYGRGAVSKLARYRMCASLLANETVQCHRIAAVAVE